MSRWQVLAESLKFEVAYILGKIYKNFNKEKIYLIGERKDQCQDNGYHLFKYVRNNYKQEKFYYCIEKNSSELKRIKSLGNIIYYKSFKHYFYYVIADKLVCAHVGSCTPDTPIVWRNQEKGKLIKKKIFIQHGITKELISSLMYKNTKFYRFICGAKKEYDFILDNFGYGKKSVKYLGFCRFDNLQNYKTRNMILVMPTWRQWFGMDNQEEKSIESFKSSKYFKKYNEFLNNEEIIKILEDNNIELIFYPHNEMQRYIKVFESNSKNIIIAKKEKYEIQELLKDAKILITDYSSIAFDFAYMRKPLLYYQFDEEEYFSEHYKKGYFDYYKNGFGEVVKDMKDLNREIKKLIENGIDKKFEKREKEFFPKYDNGNCERHYREIVSNGE